MSVVRCVDMQAHAWTVPVQMALHQQRCTLQEVHLDDVLLTHHVEPAEGPGTTGLLELCFSLPAAAASAQLTIDFQKAFLTVFDHPPDAHRGFDIPAALLTFLDTSLEHQVYIACYY